MSKIVEFDIMHLYILCGSKVIVLIFFKIAKVAILDLEDLDLKNSHFIGFVIIHLSGLFIKFKVFQNWDW